MIMTIDRGLEERRTKSGKTRRTIRIDATPVHINVDPKALGAPVADAIANHYRERIRRISAKASDATIEYRKKAAKAFSEGKSWAIKRYAGGRLGALPPNQSDRLFNDSERTANSIVAGAGNDNAWRINFAANRLDPSTAGVAGVQRIWTRLTQLVPEFLNLSLLFEQNTIARKTLERVNKERIQFGKVAREGLSQFQKFLALNAREVG